MGVQDTQRLMQPLPRTHPLSSDTIVVRRDGLLEAEIDSEIVALNVDSGTCYGLNRIGSRIWSLLAAPMQIGDICARLLAEYDVEACTCEHQVLDLLEELRAEGLIATPKEK